MQILRKVVFLAGLILLMLLFVFFIRHVFNYLQNPNPDKTFILPRIEISVLEISDISKEKMVIHSKMLVENNLPFVIHADSLEYSIYLNNTRVLKSTYKDSIHIAGYDSSWVEFPITIYIHQLDSVIKQSEKMNLDSATYTLKGSLYANFLVRKKFKLDISRDLPLIHIPKVNLDVLSVDSLNLKRASLEMKVLVENQNVFDIKARNIRYEISVEDHEWVSGTIPGLTNIRAKHTTEIPVYFRISFREVNKSLFDLLKKGSRVSYKLRLTMQVESENKIIQNSHFVLVSEGIVRSLIRISRKE